MKHRVKQSKMSRPLGQRKALLKSLLRAVIISGKIKTTTPKAKFIKPHVDKIISLSKKNTLSARRLAFKQLGDHNLVKKLFNEIGPGFKESRGGYCRIYNLGCRNSDGASMSLLELKDLPGKKLVKKDKKEASGKVGRQEKKEPKEDRKAKKSDASGLKKMFKKKKNR